MYEYVEQIKRWIESQQLIHIDLARSHAGKHQMVARILRFDAETQSLLCYDVDEKKVYSISLDEVETFDAGGSKHYAAKPHQESELGELLRICVRLNKEDLHLLLDLAKRLAN